MSGLTLTVEHAGGGSSALNILSPDALGDADTPSLQTARITRNLIREPEAADEAEVSVYRDAWREVEDKLDRINDKLLVEENGSAIFGGRLRDYEYGGTTVSVIIDGPKRDAIDAESSAGSELYTAQNDTTILSSILSRVDTVSAGTTQTVDGAIAFSESYASPGKSITKLAAAADAEVQYQATGSGFVVDYVDRLGSDRITETLSPSNGNVLGSIRLREKTRQNVNTLTVLGAGSGRGQTTASATAASFDPATDRTVERKHKDKDIIKEDRAAALAQTLVDEYDGSREYLEVECELPKSVDPSVGDSFTVELPAYDRSEALRITMLERIIDTTGDLYRAVLSNRRHTRTTDGQQRADSVQSLNEGNAGQIVRDSQSEGFTKVDSGEPQEWFFDFPSDVIDEFEATLRIESRPFRRPATAIGHDHSFSVPDHDHSFSVPDHTHEVEIFSHKHDVEIEAGTTSVTNNDFQQTDSGGFFDNRGATVAGVTLEDGGTTHPDTEVLNNITIDSNSIQTAVNLFVFNIHETSASGGLVGSFGLDCEVKNLTKGETYSQLAIFTQQDMSNAITVPVFKDIDGDDLEIRLTARLDSEITFDASYYFASSGGHTHFTPVSTTETTKDGGAQIVSTENGGATSSTTANGGATSSTTANGGATSSTTSSETSLQSGIVTTSNEVSNVAVDIDGTTVVSGLSPPIQETVGITGELTSGSNTITATSDSLGEVRTSVTYEALKNASR